jgi:hypothetical protein
VVRLLGILFQLAAQARNIDAEVIDLVDELAPPDFRQQRLVS